MKKKNRLSMPNKEVVNRRRLRIIWGTCGCLCLIGLSMLFTLPISAIIQYPVSTVVTDRDGVPLASSLSIRDEWCFPVPLDEMGKWSPQVAISLEDKRFYLHPGVDPLAVLRAFFMNHTEGKITSGASTITSQVIRLSIPRKRTLANKIREFSQALLLEGLLEKRKILELYLNLAPFGGNIRGIEAASLAYFNKRAKYLSLGESTFLISLIRSPSQLRPDRYPLRAQDARNRNLNKLFLNGVISRETLTISQSEPILPHRFPFTQEGRMAARQISKHAPLETQVEMGLEGRMRSTIDIKLQRIAAAALKDALYQFPDRVTASAILVENTSGAVRAYIGNARQDQQTDTRWVDCAIAPRSPGSALKPFVYARAIEMGLITPATLLADTPQRMQGGAPRNFDRNYRGPVSARVALADSLNIPAVRVLRQVGYINVLDLYKQLGFSYFTYKADHYLDSLILGGCEVSPLELARGYAVLARYGQSTSLKWLEEDKNTQDKQILSAAACFITLDILQDTRRLIPLYRKLFQQNDLDIAFKTGTSYALRDAWTAAVTKKHTLVIWMGDPTGLPHPGLIGLEATTHPALLIMRAIEPAQSEKFSPPKEVQKRSVCALSGAYPNQYCNLTISDWFIPGISNSEMCVIHANHNGTPLLNWPQELHSWANPERESQSQPSLRIISPKNEEIFLLNNGKNSINIKAEIESDAKEYFWFLNDAFIGTSFTPSRQFNLLSGKYHLTVATNDGVESSVSFEVKDRAGTHDKDYSLPLL